MLVYPNAPRIYPQGKSYLRRYVSTSLSTHIRYQTVDPLQRERRVKWKIERCCTIEQGKRDERYQDKGERERARERERTRGWGDERETTWQDMKQWRLERLRDRAQQVFKSYAHTYIQNFTQATLGEIPLLVAFRRLSWQRNTRSRRFIFF